MRDDTWVLGLWLAVLWNGVGFLLAPLVSKSYWSPLWALIGQFLYLGFCLVAYLRVAETPRALKGLWQTLKDRWEEK